MPVKKRKAKAKPKPATKLRGAVVKPGSPGSARPPGAPKRKEGEKFVDWMKRFDSYRTKKKKRTAAKKRKRS